MAAGLLNQMWSTREHSDAEFLAMCIEDAQLAESLGFDTLWFGEHHFGRRSALYPRIPILEILIAVLGRETERIKLGSGIKQLTSIGLDEIQGVDSSSGPPRLIEEMSMLDLVTPGRVVWSLGAGATYGDDGVIRDKAPEGNAARVEAILRRTVQLLRDPLPGDPLITPTPRDDLLDRVWMGTTTPSTIQLTAELGLKLIIGQARDPATCATFVDQYHAAGGTSECRGVRLVHVAETDAEALDAVGPPVRELYRHMTRNYTRPGTSPDDDLGTILTKMNYAVGDPATVRAKLDEFAEASGVDKVDAMIHIPGLQREYLHRSMRLYAQEVDPHLAAA